MWRSCGAFFSKERLGWTKSAGWVANRRTTARGNGYQEAPRLPSRKGPLTPGLYGGEGLGRRCSPRRLS
jgi:hypothetical protein